MIDLSCVGLNKYYQFIMCNRFYPALKTLEQLEHTYLPRVSNHWFSQTMAEAIPQLRNRIKDASMTDLKDFLENIRKHSAKIGEVAMRHVSDFNSCLSEYFYPPTKLEGYSFGCVRPSIQSVRPSVLPSIHPHSLSVGNHISVPIGQI